MIFKQWQQVLDGTKTQTRRLVKEGDSIHSVANLEHGKLVKTDYYVEQGDGRVRWKTWRSYAIQPGRGKKGRGRIRLLGIRSEPLWDIDGPDCLAEGLSACDDQGMHKTVLDLFDEYAQLWDSIYGKLPGCSWDDNPEVWVLEFEVMK